MPSVKAGAEGEGKAWRGGEVSSEEHRCEWAWWGGGDGGAKCGGNG